MDCNSKCCVCVCRGCATHGSNHFICLSLCEECDCAAMCQENDAVPTTSMRCFKMASTNLQLQLSLFQSRSKQNSWNKYIVINIWLKFRTENQWCASRQIWWSVERAISNSGKKKSRRGINERLRIRACRAVLGIEHKLFLVLFARLFVSAAEIIHSKYRGTRTQTSPTPFF